MIECDNGRPIKKAVSRRASAAGSVRRTCAAEGLPPPFLLLLGGLLVRVLGCMADTCTRVSSVGGVRVGAGRTEAAGRRERVCRALHGVGRGRLRWLWGRVHGEGGMGEAGVQLVDGREGRLRACSGRGSGGGRGRGRGRGRRARHRGRADWRGGQPPRRRGTVRGVVWGLAWVHRGRRRKVRAACAGTKLK